MVLGIDLGTTFCAVAYVDKEEGAKIIPNSDNELITPSVIWANDSELLIGKAANNRRIDSPNNIIEYIKREIGESSKKFSRSIAGISYDAEELSAVLLYKIVMDANLWLMENNIVEQPVNDVVITVPAYFDDLRRKATQRAGKLAGLNVIGIINEPTAAAISYGLELQREKNIMVFDLGGGTFDVTLMKNKPNDKMEVLISEGNMMLGGKDWDSILAKIIIKELKEKHGLEAIPIKLQYSINEKAKQVKLKLTEKTEERIIISYNGHHYPITITREVFETRSTQLLMALRAKTEQVIKKAKEKYNFISWRDVDHFVLVGGATRMPMIPKMVSSFYDGDIVIGDVDLAVAKGAALYGQDKNKVIDVSPKSLGVKIKDGQGYKVSVMIEKNTPLPCEYTASFIARPNAKITVMQGDGGKQGGIGPYPAYHEIGTIELNNPVKENVDITYKYNTNGVVVVKYKDSNGNESEVSINTSITENNEDLNYSFIEKKEKVDALIKMLSY